MQVILRDFTLVDLPTKWHLLYFGDFNGDGKTDILHRTSTTDNNAQWYKAINTGKYFDETHTILIRLLM
ncbi:MAG: VCBS repeat-containing protein [Saprospiraceae bacterium]